MTASPRRSAGRPWCGWGRPSTTSIAKSSPRSSSSTPWAASKTASPATWSKRPSPRTLRGSDLVVESSSGNTAMGLAMMRSCTISDAQWWYEARPRRKSSTAYGRWASTSFWWTATCRRGPRKLQPQGQIADPGAYFPTTQQPENSRRPLPHDRSRDLAATDGRIGGRHRHRRHDLRRRALPQRTGPCDPGDSRRSRGFGLPRLLPPAAPMHALRPIYSRALATRRSSAARTSRCRQHLPGQ